MNRNLLMKWFDLKMGLIFLVLVVNACQKGPNEPSEIKMQDFYQTWVHSYEENSTDTSDVYRPESYKEFQPSRFRRMYIFEEDGTCQWLVLHPADAHYIESGTWLTSGKDNREILLYDANGQYQKSISFRIQTLQKALLEITAIE